MSGLAMMGVLTDENGKKYKFSLEEIVTQQPQPDPKPPEPEPQPEPQPPTAAGAIPLSPQDPRFKNNASWTTV